LRLNRNYLIATMARDPNIDEVPGEREQSEQALQHFDAAVRELEAAFQVLGWPMDPPD
jgi:hypothetical protein